jgi:transcriptional regulator with XRE-family HTH domain
MGNILHSQAGGEREDILANLGANVRQIRRDRGLSQNQLALLAGMSRRMLAAIEGGATNVSLSVVDRIAAALEVRFTRLVRPPDAEDSRRISALAWRGTTRDSRAELLGAAPGSRETELWLWTLAEGESYPSEDNSGDWHEMLLVLEGYLIVRFADHERRVDKGDYLIFSSAERYEFVNGGNGSLRFMRNVVL